MDSALTQIKTNDKDVSYTGETGVFIGKRVADYG